MMEMGEAMIARLKADSAVTARCAGRVHWLIRPQAEPLPAIVLQIVSEDHPQHLDGFEDMATARVQVDCMAMTYSAARLLAKAAQAALIDEKTVVDPTGPDVIFWRSDVEGPRDLGEDGSEGFVHRASSDLIIRYGTQA